MLPVPVIRSAICSVRIALLISVSLTADIRIRTTPRTVIIRRFVSTYVLPIHCQQAIIIRMNPIAAQRQRTVSVGEFLWYIPTMYAMIDTATADMSIGSDAIRTNHPLGLIASITNSPPVRRLAGTKCVPTSLSGVVSAGVIAL